jgi:hypothetical protein
MLLDGTKITSAAFGDLSMDDGIEIIVTLRFDRAILLF